MDLNASGSNPGTTYSITTGNIAGCSRSLCASSSAQTSAFASARWPRRRGLRRLLPLRAGRYAGTGSVGAERSNALIRSASGRLAK